MTEGPQGPDGLESMAFQLILHKLTSLEQAMHAIPPLLKKIIDQLEAQATQPDVPIATYAQLYPELGASETEDLIEVVPTPVPEAPPVPQARWRFWHWFLREG